MKNYQLILIIAVFTVFGCLQLNALHNLQQAAPADQHLGIAQTEIGYKTVTNSSVSCPAATSTLVLGKDPARTSFTGTNSSANPIYLCKGTSCASGTGIYLSANGGSYEQTDGYIGDYSCIGTTSTSSLSTTSSL